MFKLIKLTSILVVLSEAGFTANHEGFEQNNSGKTFTHSVTIFDSTSCESFFSEEGYQNLRRFRESYQKRQNESTGPLSQNWNIYHEIDIVLLSGDLQTLLKDVPTLTDDTILKKLDDLSDRWRKFYDSFRENLGRLGGLSSMRLKDLPHETQKFVEFFYPTTARVLEGIATRRQDLLTFTKSARNYAHCNDEVGFKRVLEKVKRLVDTGKVSDDQNISLEYFKACAYRVDMLQGFEETKTYLHKKIRATLIQRDSERVDPKDFEIAIYRFSHESSQNEIIELKEKEAEALKLRGDKTGNSYDYLEAMFIYERLKKDDKVRDMNEKYVFAKRQQKVIEKEREEKEVLKLEQNKEEADFKKNLSNSAPNFQDFSEELFLF